jgi:hypothetical protein
MADEVVTPVASAEGAVPVEGAPVVETPVEGAPVGEVASTETPAAEKTAEELAAAEEAQKASDADFLSKLPELLKKIPEADQRRLGLQYANRTMAAARRAEKATETVARENAQLKAKLSEAPTAPDVRKDAAGWMKANGFATARALIDHLVAAGGEPKKAEPLDELAKLREEIAAEKRDAAAARDAAIDDASKVAVAGALAKDPKFFYAAKPSGVARLWGEITEYRKVHGHCPNAAVFHLAGEIEREMRSEFGEPARPAAKVTTPTGAAKPAGGAAGGDATTITNAGSGGAPVVREYSMNPDERRAQINAELIAEGLLKKSTG